MSILDLSRRYKFQCMIAVCIFPAVFRNIFGGQISGNQTQCMSLVRQLALMCESNPEYVSCSVGPVLSLWITIGLLEDFNLSTETPSTRLRLLSSTIIASRKRDLQGPVGYAHHEYYMLS